MKTRWGASENDLRQMAVRQAETVAKVGEELIGFMNKDDSSGEVIKYLEEQGDKERSALVRSLFESYVTPIDREDLYLASFRLDNLIDLVHLFSEETLIFRGKNTFVGLGEEIAKAYAETVPVVKAIVYKEKAAEGNLLSFRRIISRCRSMYRDALEDLYKPNRTSITVEELFDIMCVKESLRRLGDITKSLDELAEILGEIVAKA